MAHSKTNSTSTPPPGISPALWALILELPNSCYPRLIPNIHNDYHYHPHLAAGVVFCIAFGLALIAHSVQFVRFRRWTSVLFTVGALSKYLCLSRLVTSTRVASLG